MYLIAGLGNPEKKYEKTRHNIGFSVVSALCDKYSVSMKATKHKAKCAECKIGAHKVIVAQPQTYMNLSGEAISAIASFYKIPLEKIIVVYDDISLPLGKIRIRPKGSAGGHNGIKSIISCLSSEVFGRIKIGVGSPSDPDYDLADFVLGKFSKEEQKSLCVTIDKTIEAIECIVKEDIDKAMNLYNN